MHSVLFMHKTIVEVCSGSVVYVECSACDQMVIGGHAQIKRWGQGLWTPPPPEKSQKYRVSLS